MITLSAKVTIKGDNPSPFVIGQSAIGSGYFGENIAREDYITNRQLLSLESGLSDRETGATISWGVISDGGKISFNKNESFVRLANMGVEIEGSGLDVFINNTLTKKSEQVGEYVVSRFSYDLANKVSTIEFTDGLQDWQDATFEGFTIDPLDFESVFLTNLYERLRLLTEEQLGIRMTALDKLDKATYNHLGRYNLPMSLIKPQSFWSVWDKFGKATQTHIFKRADGEVTCKYEGGN